MIIELVSLKRSLSKLQRQKNVLSLFNESRVDIILFPGQTFRKLDDLLEIEDELVPNKCTAFMEVRELRAGSGLYWTFKIVDGKIINCYTSQIFKQSADFMKYPYCAEHLYNSIISRRLHKVNGKTILHLICGELNILKNTMADNSVSFRTNSPQLKQQYEDLLNSVDIILNPMHSIMGNQGKLQRRREFLSAKSRSYFSTCDFDIANKTPHQLLSLQYAYFDAKPITAINVTSSRDSLKRSYTI